MYYLAKNNQIVQNNIFTFGVIAYFPCYAEHMKRKGFKRTNKHFGT